MYSLTHHITQATPTEEDISAFRQYVTDCLSTAAGYSHIRVLSPTEYYPHYVLITFWHNRKSRKHHKGFVTDLIEAF